eukprot:1371239-Amorphochlora_amoeboformis.AAC.1
MAASGSLARLGLVAVTLLIPHLLRTRLRIFPPPKVSKVMRKYLHGQHTRSSRVSPICMRKYQYVWSHRLEAPEKLQCECPHGS